MGYGRAEKRTIYVLENLSFIDALQEWKNVNSIILVERLIQQDGKDYARIKKDNAIVNLHLIRK